MSERCKFLILDGHGLIYRAIYRPGPPLTSPGGEPTRGTYTFCQMLFSMVENIEPNYLVFADDAPRKSTFRRKLYSPYKTNRKYEDEGPPQEIVVQVARCKQIVKALGVPVLGASGFEADDVIASLVDACGTGPIECVVGSRDKDLHQLVGPNCRLYDPVEREWWDERRVLQKWGVRSIEDIVELQTLQGDSTDNIPGVPGIGPKTALKLILEHGTAERARAMVGRKGESCLCSKPHLDLMRKLVTLRRDVPLFVTPAALEFDGFRMDTARKLFRKLGFRTFL